MKVINDTGWDTRDLRKLFYRGLQNEGVNPQPYRITVRMARGTRVTGFGNYTRPCICLFIPKVLVALNEEAEDIPMPQPLVEELCQIFIHEVGHTQGLRHREMMAIEDIDVSKWTDAMKFTVRRSQCRKRRRKQKSRICGGIHAT